MPTFAKGQPLTHAKLSVETVQQESLEALFSSSIDGRVVIAPEETVDWRAAVTDYSEVVGPAQPGRWPRHQPQAWWHSRLLSPQLSISILQNAVHIGDSVLVTASGKYFEYSFPRYNRAPTNGAVVTKTAEGFHYACDVVAERTIAGLSFLIGDLPGQFGHFVLEVFARVWALKLLQQLLPDVPLRLVAFGGNLRQWQQDLLTLSDWAKHDITVLNEPAVFEAAIVASPAFVLHKAVSLKAAPAYATISQAADPDVRSASRRIYVSRSHWPKLRRLDDEEKVERLFQERGFEIIHPQTLTVREQVAIARSAKSLCGPVGSGMYLAAFQAPGASNFVVAPRDFALPDDRMLAHLTGADVAYYFGSGERAGVERSASWGVDLDGLAAALDRWMAKPTSPSAERRDDRHAETAIPNSTQSPAWSEASTKDS